MAIYAYNNMNSLTLDELMYIEGGVHWGKVTGGVLTFVGSIGVASTTGGIGVVAGIVGAISGTAMIIDGLND
ncbi:Blp family class II bacteriocin [Petroclostridium xylanilyticum]|jgi:hypothetical protein|uniref:Blp family class II bacteriocin n=1 Tax=Petroclostridium xylanilyticum TaxID=1792311 RepID=UPI000B993AC2|nr:hypothetical protein [Petroclostridium xylanilyticum]